MADPTNRVIAQFRNDALRAAVEARQDGHSFSDIVQTMLDRYVYMLQRSLPDFSEAEASLLVDALNGTLFHKETVHLLWAEIDAAIQTDGLAEKWQVDGAALVERLRKLTPFEALAVIDAVERFWSGSYRQEGSMRDKLHAVGLIK